MVRQDSIKWRWPHRSAHPLHHSDEPGQGRVLEHLLGVGVKVHPLLLKYQLEKPDVCEPHGRYLLLLPSAPPSNFTSFTSLPVILVIRHRPASFTCCCNHLKTGFTRGSLVELGQPATELQWDLKHSCSYERVTGSNPTFETGDR